MDSFDLHRTVYDCRPNETIHIPRGGGRTLRAISAKANLTIFQRYRSMSSSVHVRMMIIAGFDVVPFCVLGYSATIVAVERCKCQKTASSCYQAFIRLKNATTSYNTIVEVRYGQRVLDIIRHVV